MNFNTLIIDQNGHLRIWPIHKILLPSYPKATLLDVDRDKIINIFCTYIFEQIIRKEPLTSQSLTIQEKNKVKRLLKAISINGDKTIHSQIKADLNELIESPETLEARLALRSGINPKPLYQTINGTYILYNRKGQPWGIFKLQRQEVGCDKNPSWLIWLSHQTEEWGIESGTGYLRECATYQLDHEHFSQVPLTVETQFENPIFDTSVIPIFRPNYRGSFQRFKDGCDKGSEAIHKYEFQLFCIRRADLFFKKIIHQIMMICIRILFYFGIPHIPELQVHKMAILDLRLLNCDRHLDNFLVERSSKTIYPIDHGLVLPIQALHLRFHWKYLVQSSFPMNQETLDYIERLNPEEDQKILRSCGISSQCALDRMKISTELLKRGAARGLTLYQIADLMLEKVGPNKTYFEKEICQEILLKGKSSSSVINSAIDRYLQ